MLQYPRHPGGITSKHFWKLVELIDVKKASERKRPARATFAMCLHNGFMLLGAMSAAITLGLPVGMSVMGKIARIYVPGIRVFQVEGEM